ncbi:MAG: gamma-glutamyltransferase family protein [Nitriliruptor sp.]|nr:MAG: gamma-glutamyltransferase family protein [Nitriliruptor sp.]
MDQPTNLRRHAVASPHRLASAAGADVLREGGNAVDAAVATNLVLSTVTPYYCGVGGDLLAIVHDGSAHGLMSAGTAPRGATPDAVRAAAEAAPGPRASEPGTAGMPTYGALAVTVPGATAGWFELLARWGTRSFGDLAQAAIDLAEGGFVVSEKAAGFVDAARANIGDQPGWQRAYGSMAAGESFRQPDLAGTLRTLAEHGPDALYGGVIGERVVAALQASGSSMTLQDLAGHRVEDVGTISGRFRDIEVLELPPPTQGVTALTALGILDELGDPASDPQVFLHRQIEAVRAAMADRASYLGDPAHMQASPSQLLDRQRLRAIADGIDDDRAANWPPASPLPGGTAYMCAVDGDGLMVSLIQSNFRGFGSGIVPDGTGFGLHDRGAHFRLEAGHPTSIGPGRRPPHTLIPALALRDGSPWLAFGTMGADGQPQTQLQFLSHLLDAGHDVGTALDAPRFLVDVADGSVGLESRFGPQVEARLRSRGHVVRSLAAYEDLAGHAHAIQITPAGLTGGSDPRCEGGVAGA